jgi:hypothetical protein
MTQKESLKKSEEITVEEVGIAAKPQNSFAVYISCVGERDPFGRENTEGPLLTCLRYLTEIKRVQFNSIYLIPSSKETSPKRHTEDRAEECRQNILENMQVDVQIYPMKVENPADLTRVYPTLRDILTDIRREVESKAPSHSLVFHINVSSGTKQMTDSLPHLVSVGVLEPYEVYLWQVFDPLHFPKLQDRVLWAPELDLLAQERILFQLERLAEQHMYQETMVLLKQELTVDYIDFAKQLYAFLASHDQWLYKQAHTILNKLNTGQVPDFMQDWLQGLENRLQEIIEGNPSTKVKMLAVDRYYCGWRRLESGLYPDAINHFWAACELALRQHGEDIKAIQPAEQITAFELIERIRNVRQGSPLNQVEITPQSQAPQFLLNAVDWLRRIRNEIEHGSRPVDKQLAQNARQIAESVLQALEWLPSEDSLRPDIVKKNLLQLIRAMRDSLWR